MNFLIRIKAFEQHGIKVIAPTQADFDELARPLIGRVADIGLKLKPMLVIVSNESRGRPAAFQKGRTGLRSDARARAALQCPVTERSSRSLLLGRAICRWPDSAGASWGRVTRHAGPSRARQSGEPGRSGNRRSPPRRERNGERDTHLQSRVRPVGPDHDARDGRERGSDRIASTGSAAPIRSRRSCEEQLLCLIPTPVDRPKLQHPDTPTALRSVKARLCR